MTLDNVFDLLALIGGLCLFLFGMNVMGEALERRAGHGLQRILSRLTTNRFAGLATGLGVTSVIQSSSATTVMVVGFVNSKLMTLRQAINVIMGANIGTTVTAWLISLTGISGESFILKLLKPTSFTPILALIGVILIMFSKKSTRKDLGTIFMGFAALMFGMDMMSDSVAFLADLDGFRNLFVAFQEPILGVIVGMVLTAIIQSSSASVGILQALALTGIVSYGAAIPIIMGQNIGTCITAILASFGTNRNAKRAALVHLSFNVIGTTIGLIAFYIIRGVATVPLFGEPATVAGIAVAHSLFNVSCTLILFPMGGLLEKLVCKLVPEIEEKEQLPILDEHLFATPAIAVMECKKISVKMAQDAVNAMKNAISCIKCYDEELAKEVKELEEKTDKYEDIIGSYLVKLGGRQTSDLSSAMETQLLKIINDIERIADHAVNITESAEEMKDKKLAFSETAIQELEYLFNAILEILDTTYSAFIEDDLSMARKVEPLEEVVDKIKENIRNRHIARLQQGECSIELGFVLSDLLNDLERTSDHCSNIAGNVIDIVDGNLNIHQSLRETRLSSEEYKTSYNSFAEKYLAPIQ